MVFPFEKWMTYDLEWENMNWHEIGNFSKSMFEDLHCIESN